MQCPGFLFIAFLGVVAATTALYILLKLLSLTAMAVSEVRWNNNVKRQRENERLRALPGPLHTPRDSMT